MNILKKVIPTSFILLLLSCDASQNAVPIVLDDNDVDTPTTVRELVITYEDMPVKGGLPDERFSFQIVIHENGAFETLHRSVHSATDYKIGLFGFQDFEYAYDTIVAVDRSQIKFAKVDDEFISASVVGLYDEQFKWREVDGEVIDIADGEFTSQKLPGDFDATLSPFSFINISEDGYIWLSAEQAQERVSLETLQEGTWLFAGFIKDFSPDPGSQITYHLFERTVVDDCMGVRDGFAFLDDCQVCVEGTSSARANATKDCQGRCNGTAIINDCGNCYGADEAQAPEDINLGCGCGLGPQKTVYPDTDDDGLGDGTGEEFCPQDIPVGYVENNDDTEPDCSTNDEARCGKCGTLGCDDVCGSGAWVDACGKCLSADEASTCSGVDLVVDAWDLASRMYIQHLYVDPETCLVAERCVSGTGNRKLLKFSTSIANIGSDDLQLGVPENNNPLWEYDQCHEHFHFEAYAEYKLTDNTGEQIRDLGHKNGFSVQDLGDYDLSERPCNRRYSSGNQGISSGCVDIYGPTLECQWVDITALPNGQYTLKVDTNPEGLIQETRTDNNPALVEFVLNDDDVYVSNFENVGEREQSETRTVNDLPEYLQLVELNCNDGIDNDEDTLTDCEDPNCEFVLPCFKPLDNAFCETPAILEVDETGTPTLFELDQRYGVENRFECQVNAKEQYFQVTPPSDGYIYFSNTNFNFGVSWLSDCETSDSCHVYDQLKPVVGGQTYLLAIDSSPGTASMYFMQSADNTSCETAIPVDVTPGEMSANVMVDTHQYIDSNVECGDGRNMTSAYYSVVAPVDGHVVLNQPSGAIAAMGVISSENCSATQCDEPQRLLEVQAGQTYIIKADLTPNGFVAQGQFQFYFVEGDLDGLFCEYSTAQDISHRDETTINIDFSTTFFDQACSQWPIQYYHFIAPRDGHYLIEGEDVFSGIFQDCSTSDCRNINFRKRYNTTVVAGERYIIAVTAGRNDVTQSRLGLIPVESPENQSCDTALAIEVPSNGDVVSVWADTELYTGGSPCSEQYGGESPNAFFQFNAPRDGQIRIQGVEDNFDTVIGIYRQTCEDTLICVDDPDDQAHTLQVTAGETYIISVGGFGRHFGSARLEIGYVEQS